MGVAHGHIMSRDRWCHHLVVWSEIAKKLRYTGFIKDSKGKELVLAREGISTPKTPYLR
jgi:hypothetical protein